MRVFKPLRENYMFKYPSLKKTRDLHSVIKSHASQSGKEESQHWLGLQPAREAMFLFLHLADDTVVIFKVILCTGTDRFDMPRLVDIMSRSSMRIRNGSSLGIVD